MDFQFNNDRHQNRRSFFVLLFFLLGLNVIAVSQQRRIDSLHRLLQTKMHDTTRLSAWTLLANTYRTTIPDSAIFYAKKVLAVPSSSATFVYKSLSANALGYGSYFKGRYNEALDAFIDYYRFAEKVGDKNNMAYAANNQGNVFIELGNYEKAIAAYKKALQIRQEIKDEYGIAMSNNNIGFVYKDIGDYENAVSHFFYALQQYEKLNRQPDIAITYNFLGTVYYKKHDFENAKIYQTKALNKQVELQDRNGMGISLQSLANIYSEQRDYANALNHFLKAKSIYKEKNDERQLSLVNSSIGALYAKQEKWSDAMPFFTESITQSQRIGNRRSLAELWLHAANGFIHLNNLPAARSLLDSTTLAVAQTGNKEHRKYLYEVETSFYEAVGDAKKALSFARYYSSQKDSLLNEANVKSLNDMQVKYESGKKQQTIELLNKENAIKELEIANQQLMLRQRGFELTENKLALAQTTVALQDNEIIRQRQTERLLKQEIDSTVKEQKLTSLKEAARLQALQLANTQLAVSRRNVLIASLAGGSVLILLLAYSVYRRKQIAQEARLQLTILEQQEKATKAVLEAEEAERQRIAKDLHDGVGQMMSAAKMNLSAYEHAAQFQTNHEKQSFEKIIQLVDESCAEVRAVSHNMMPNALLKNSLAAAVREFISKLDSRQLEVHLYTEGLEERLDFNVETVLYRVIQECVNNVIRHSGASKLDISLIKDKEEITATIEDNGKGFDPDRLLREGMGLKNIRTRIQYLKGSVDFDSAPGRGTLVALHIPL